MIRSTTGFGLVGTLITIAVTAFVIGGGFLMLNSERAKTRDSKRLADMARVQAAFEFLFNDTASYALAAQNGCSQAGSPVSSCNLKQYFPTLGQLQDPGKLAYTVSKAPSEEGYEVTFTLEYAYGSLAAGRHTLSPDGIQ
ncbi:MAG: hypothetical protein V1916_01310 [Patescibacteria group bacterium]